MADIKFNFESDDLEQLKKLLDDIRKQLAKIKKGDIIGDDEAVKAKKLAAEALKVENAMKRQELAAKGIADKQERINQKQKESQGIIGGLKNRVRELGKELDSATDPRDIDRLNRELKETRKRLTDAKNTTASWGKALGSFQFKFNALGNIAANVLNGITSALRNNIRQFISLEKIIGSNQATADKYDIKIGALKGSFEALNRALALGDLEDLGDQMVRGAEAAANYVAALDVLGDTQNALNIQTARSRREVKELQEIYNDTSQDSQKRFDAAIKAQEILNNLQTTQQEIAEKTMRAELDRVQQTFGLTDEQTEVYKRFIENYGLLTDQQITSLERLEAKATETVDAEKKINRARVLSWLETGATVSGAQQDYSAVIEQTQKRVEEYDKVSKQLSETLGVDVQPIMKALIGTNDEQRTSVVSSIIAYEDQIGATQRLQNANAAMLGSIKRTIESENKQTKAIKDSNEELEEQVEWMSKLFVLESSWDLIAKSGEEATTILAARMREMNRVMVDTTDVSIPFRDKWLGALSLVGNAVNSLSGLFEKAKQKELSAVGDNAEKRLEIEKEYAKKQQALAVGQSIIDGAQAVTEIWSKYAANPPLAALFTALAVSTVGAQIATIKKQKFAKGGEVYGPSHSFGGVNAELEGGEYVINKRSTSKYKDLLEGINQNDQIKVMMALDKDRKPNFPRQDPWTRKIYEAIVDQETGYETPEFYVIKKGNMKVKLHK